MNITIKEELPTVVSNFVLNRKDYEWETNDCVVRAMATAAEVEYAVAHQWVKKYLGREDKKGTFYTKEKLNRLAKKNIGIGNKQLKPHIDLINKKYTHKKVQFTVGTFSKHYNSGSWFILVRGHALSIKDGVIYDHAAYYRQFRRPIRAAFRLIDNQ